MPIHLDNLDIIPEVEGADSVLIVACNMCAGASLAMIENTPFLEVFRSFLTSPPLEKYIQRLQFLLSERGVKSKWFKGGVIQQFFLCLWTARQRNKLQEYGKNYEAVIVLGCDSAIETASNALKGTGCRVIKGMKVGGIVNTKTKFHYPCNLSLEENKLVPMCDLHCKQFEHESHQKKEESIKV